MTTLSPNVTQELETALEQIEKAQEASPPIVPVNAALILAHEAVERALCGVQHARCEAVASLEKL